MASYETVSFELTGIAPLLVQNGQLANPMHDSAKALKALTGKRKKTDADLEEIARTEFLWSLYLDSDGEPCIPGENIEAMLVEAAKRTREGKLAKAGMFVDHDPKIIYDGPKDPEGLWKQGKRFALPKMVKIGGVKVPKTRPIFRVWSMGVTVSFATDVINEASVVEWMQSAGRFVAIGTWRPKYGRFDAKKLK